MKDYLISNTPREYFFSVLGDLCVLFLSVYIWRYIDWRHINLRHINLRWISWKYINWKYIDLRSINPVGEYGIIRTFLWLVPLYLLFFFICDLFDMRLCQRQKMVIRRMSAAFTLILLPLLAWSLVWLNGALLWKYIPLWGLTFILLLLWRLAAGRLLAATASPRRVLIIGNTFNGKKLVQAFQDHAPTRYRFLGIVEPQEKSPSVEVGESIHVLGKIEDLAQIVDQYKPEIMVIALDERREVLPAEQFLDWKLQGIEVYDAPDFYEQVTGKILINRLRPSWLLFTCGFGNKSMIHYPAKRFFDIILSGLLLVLTSPVLLLSAILIRLDSKGPVLFKQERVGERGKIFELYKFRTMTANAEQNTGPIWTKKNDNRVTRIGRFLRQTRIDELPQLVNVFKGEMSLVGPRPERPFFVQKLDKVIPYYKQRLIVKPGITGWAAINYRYCGTLRETGEKLAYDLFYIKHRSLLLDFFIGLKTINVILFRKGAM
jgi:sugar transferase (PEP-CTERM system associated)